MDKDLKIVTSWTHIIRVAKHCGDLRRQGKYEEADKIQKDLEDSVKLCDEVLLAPCKIFLV